MDAPNPSPGRVPPSDLDAESAVLSAILLNAKSLDEVPFLESKHFYADANRKIYETALELREESRPIDIVTVAGVLRGREQLQLIGGTPYLAQLSDATPAVAHIADHAKTIVVKWELRQIIAAAQTIVTEGYHDVGDPEQWKQSVDQRIFAATRTVNREQNLIIIGDATAEAVKLIQERLNSKVPIITGVTTGLPTLDARLGGLEPSRVYVVAARPGQGKAQPLSAKVLTPTGFTTMGALKAGDWVIGGDGKPTRVRRVFERGTLPVFRVTMSDGGSTLCCDEHLWLTKSRRERRYGLGASVKNLAEIRRSLQRCASGGLNHSIPYVGPVEFETQGELPLHPYLVGVYLGDGCSDAIISNPEPDVQARFGRLLPKQDDFSITDEGKTLRVKRKQRQNQTPSHYVSALRDLGLGSLRAETKFIPGQYLTASVDDRIELLRGLCDTDGFVSSSKNIEYVTVSKRLANDIMELVKGLGGKISCAIKSPTYRYKGKKLKGQQAYRMVFGFPSGGITPVSSKKHLAKWDQSPIRVSERFIQNVTPAGKAPCRCIEVEAEHHLYVTDDYIVTHNTACATGMAIACAKPKEPNNPDSIGDGVVFISVEMPRKQIAYRVLSQVARIDSNKLIRGRNLTADEWKRLTEAQIKIRHMPIVIEDSSNHTPASIRAAMRMGRRKLQDRFGQNVKVRVGAVDYLQLLSSHGGDNREQEISAVSRAIKSIAKDEDVAMISLAQVNRECEKRKPPIPMLSDLRESGSIEQDADVVMFLYREDYYRPKEEAMDNKAQIIVAKWRDGGTGVVRCEFEPTTTTFFENSRHPDYEQLGDIFDAFDQEQYGSQLREAENWQDQYDNK